jgi:hypothetical protein
VALIAVDVVEVGGTDQGNAIRRILERCIYADQGVLLPSMGDRGSAETFFIVASTDTLGSKVIARRIDKELQNFDASSRLKPVVSSTALFALPDQSKEVQTSKITARIEQLVQAHLLRGSEGLPEGSPPAPGSQSAYE